MQLKKGRIQQNMSLEHLAQLTEIQLVDLDAFESGKKPIPVTLFLSFCELLHLPYEKSKISEPPVVDRVENPLMFPQAEPEVEHSVEPIIDKVAVNNADSTEQEEVITQPSIETLQFPGLTEELREFINKPINLPFLELAMKLSQMDAKKLRDVAESLLEITL
jgi:transcriptional regulator with XRE-family HTH domain